MVEVAEKIDERIPAPRVVNETREETIRIAKAHLSSVRTGTNLEASGVLLADVVRVANGLAAGEFERFIAGLSLVQAILLRDYFKSLLSFAEATGDGEVVLSSVVTNSIRLVAKNTGLVSFLHDTISVLVSMKQMEANLESRKNVKFDEGLQFLRDLEVKFEQNAEKMAAQFVA